MDAVPSHDVKILLGNFNAWTQENVLGKVALGQRVDHTLTR